MMRNLLLLVILISSVLLLAGNPARGLAQAGDPYSLIDAVNSLRAANGLPSYEVDNILMSVAQAHTDYQAAIGQVTHTGAGGTRPIDRASAAGYGGGASFFISENIAGGTNFSVETVINMWLQDEPHILTMLGSNYQRVGAGVAVSGDFVYYTLDAASGASSSSNSPSSPSTSSSSTPGGPTAIPIYLVQTTTPKPDGSVVHTVLSGQTLIDIAKAYGVTVNEIKELNYLTSDDIYVGDQLVIRRAGSPVPTLTETATSTPTRAATSTRHPTRTPSPSPTAQATSLAALAAPALKDSPPPSSDPLGSILVVAIVVLAAGGVILMVVGTLIKRTNR